MEKKKKRLLIEIGVGVVLLVIAGLISLIVIKKAYDKGDVRESYVACGCGCCDEAYEERCLYHANGDDIDQIIEEDIKIAQNPSCEIVGCSKGISYSYCD